MFNIAKSLELFEAKRAALAARAEEIMTKSVEEGRTLEVEETEEYDGIASELKAVDEHLSRLRTMQSAEAAKAKSVAAVTTIEEGTRQRGGIITVKDNLPPGIEFARYAIAIASSKGNPMLALEIAKQRYPDQARVHNVLKAAVAAGTTTHVTWASPLAPVDTGFMGDFVDFLRPATIIGKFGQNGIPGLHSIPFNVSIPGQTSGGAGYWHGQGQATGLTKFAFERNTLGFTKVGNIAVLTDELIRFSSPSAEALVRDQLAAALIDRIDTDLVDPANSGTPDVKPASITYSNAAAAVVSVGTDADAVRTDIYNLSAKFIAANIQLMSGVWIMPATVALALSLMRNGLGNREFPDLSMKGGMLEGFPVIVSEYVPNVLITTVSPNRSRDIMILVDASEIWLADDGQVTLDASNQASLLMDTAPTGQSVSTGSPNAPAASTVVSMWQTNSVALKAERYINWKLRRPAACYFVKDVAYSPTIA